MAKTPREKIDYIIQDISKYLFSDIYLVKEKSEELLKIANQPDDNYGRSYAFLFLSYYYIYSDYEELCLYTMKKARDLSNDSEIVADYHFFRGIYYYSVCNNYDAIKELFESMDYYRRNNRFVSHSYALIYAARIISELEEYKMEHAMLEEAIESSLQCEEPYRSELLALCYVELAVNACNRNRFEDAKRAIEDSNELNGNKNSLILSAIKIHYLSKLNQQEDLTRSAKRFIQEFLMSENDKAFEFTSIERVTKDMIEIGNFDMARTCIKVIDATYEKTHLRNSIEITKMKINYIEKFNVEQYQTIYEEFYEQVTKCIQVDEKVQSENIKNEILLNEINESQETILKENEELRAKANIDELTQLYNRSFHTKILNEIVKTDEVKSIGYIMLDIDYFKYYNDNYGHLNGDLVLKEIGASLKKFSNENIYSCRYGGDEFNCICVNNSKEEVEKFIEQVVQDIQNKNIKHEFSLVDNKVTVSIGYDIQAVVNGETVQQAIENADKAVYLAKNQGRNNWKQYME